MRVGIHITRFDAVAPEGIAVMLRDTGRVADETGIEAITLMDHYLQLEFMGAVTDPMLEGYTGLGYLAGTTTQVRLHLLVTGVTYRHPGLLAKIVSTLDVLSGGRALLGIGAAWFEREHRALGVPFPPVAERFELLEETLAIVTQMWSDDDGPFTGPHFQLAETINAPQPVQRPRPPILIGGGGERKTLKLVARYADIWNIGYGRDGDLDMLRHKLGVLAGHCAEQGRDPATIATSLMWVGAAPTTPETTEEFLAQMRAVAAVVPVRDVHVITPAGDAVAHIVIPRIDVDAYVGVHGLTDFEREVYRALAAVPYGTAVSYRDLAAAAGHPNAYRAAGSAMARNELPVILPCHRVVKNDGRLGHYGDDPAWKARLLRLEGVAVDGDRLAAAGGRRAAAAAGRAATGDRLARAAS